MTSLWCVACVAFGLAAAGCSQASPTAPSATAAPTDPVASVSVTEPSPAPVSQTVTGTWFLNEQNFMTLTERDASVTGMEAPFTVNAGPGITVTRRGMISGTASGTSVTLTLANTVTITDGRTTTSCSGTDTFAGSVAGSTLTGTYRSGTTAYRCAASPPVALPAIDGPITFTRQ